MKLTDALLGEHAVLYELFDMMRETAANEDDITVLRSTVSVLKRLLVSHAETEEALLFPALKPHLGEMGPLAMMQAEHDEIVRLAEAAVGEGDLNAMKSTVSRLLYVSLDHFHKEEQVLFGMARQFLDEEALTALGDQWADRRKVVVDGQGCGGAG